MTQLHRAARILAHWIACTVLVSVAGTAIAAGEYDNPNEGLQPLSVNDLASVDTDGDGIAQDLEFNLARQFMPTVWFHRWETCADPAGNKNHSPRDSAGRLVYRVSPHPSHPGAIAIQYVLLYQRDCGNALLLGLNGHSGDAEPFSITLIPNPECKHGYGIYSVRTWAHEGTVAEAVNTDIHTGQCRWGFSKYSVNHDRLDGRIIVSLSKHGSFLDATECNTRFLIDQSCKKDWTPADRNLWIGANVGERAMPTIMALDALGFASEAVWVDRKFCGGLGDFGCPAPIEQKFGLYAPAPPTHTGGGGRGGDCERSRIGCPAGMGRRDMTNRRLAASNPTPIERVEWNECARSRLADLDLPADAVGAPDCAMR